MKKMVLVILFLILVGFVALGEEQEEVDFLLFLPNSSNQFTNELEAATHLDKVADYLLGKNLGHGQILVTGYSAFAVSDLDPVVLSMDRALFVINELQKRGVSEHLFAEPEAFGSVDFWGSNIDEDEREPNRRVRIVLDGQLLTPEVLVEEIAEHISVDQTEVRKNTLFPWIFLIPLLLLVLIAALLAKRTKKEKKSKPQAAPEKIIKATPQISYTVVNLEEEIRLCAYKFYIERGGQNENAYEDWCKAVNEICTLYEDRGHKTYSEDKNWWASCSSK